MNETLRWKKAEAEGENELIYQELKSIPKVSKKL